MIAELTITPMCEDSNSADYVAMVVDRIDQSGLNYQLTAMGTLIESDNWDDLFNTIHDCHKIIMRNCDRIQTDIKLDDHKGEKNLIKKRIVEVQQLTGKELKH